jgi:D-glycero-D-manno-heptose 1,7-bisphosphate phosphatase
VTAAASPGGDPAVFLDRDGVLNAIVKRDGKTSSPRLLSELRLDPDAPRALAALRAAGYRLFVVTNQPDISRGLMSNEILDAIHLAIMDALPVEEIAVCRHDNADQCACRKPKPGLLLDLAARHNIDLGRSWMIGDQDRDILCGKSAGVRTVLMDRPYNSRAGADCLAADLLQAADAILASDPR